MKIQPFAMERMQSTWENIVEFDMSESGVRPVSLRELGEMGLDLEAILDMPLGYSQSNGTLPLREALAAIYPGATADHVEVTNGTSEANYLLALALVRAGDDVALQIPNYMQYGGVPESLGAVVRPFRLSGDRNWEPDWEDFERAVTPKTRLVYLSNPHNPQAPCCPMTRCGASSIAASAPAPTCSPTKSTSAPKSNANAPAASGG